MKTLLKLLLIIIVYCLWTLAAGAQVNQRFGGHGTEAKRIKVDSNLVPPADTLQIPSWHADKNNQSSMAVIGDNLWIWSTTQQKYILPVSGSPAIAYGDVIGLADSMNTRQYVLPYNGSPTYYLGGDHLLHDLDSLISAMDFVKSTDTIITQIEGSVDPNDIPGLTTYIRNTLFGGTAIIYNPNTGVIAIDSALVVSWLSGALTDVPTLQEVLTEGNTTNLGFVATADIALDGNGNNLTIGDYDNGSGGTKLTVGQSLATLSGQWLSTGAFYYDDGTSAYTARMYVEGLTANRILQFPNASGYAAISVNGTLADANGNITISTGGATPTFQQVLTAGSAVTSSYVTTTNSFAVETSSGSSSFPAMVGYSPSSAPGVKGQSGSSYGVWGVSSTGLPGVFDVSGGSTSSVSPAIRLQNVTSGTAAAGMGVSIQFYSKTTPSSTLSSHGTIGAKWTDPALITKSSDIYVSTFNNGSESTKFTIKSTGTLNATALSTYADDAAAGTGGLVTGDIYKTSTGELRIKL